MPDPRLPSWNYGPVRRALLDFVDAVTTEGGPDYVAPIDRVASFDNDGTLYDRDSVVGRLGVALDEATKRGWPVVSMKRDWKWVFAD